MKKVIAFAVLLMLLNSCRKIDTDKNPPIANTTTDDDVFICEFPIEAEFPGGNAGWLQFLQKHLTYPAGAVNAEIEGMVVLHFTVCDDGSLCDIKAIRGPQELQQSAIDVLKKSPKWMPAKLHGRNVVSYKSQPIVYRLEAE
jgi:protein TonB